MKQQTIKYDNNLNNNMIRSVLFRQKNCIVNKMPIVLIFMVVEWYIVFIEYIFS